LLDDSVLEPLLYESEGNALDFKRDQYPFEQASEDAKSELLKDILAFANSFRRSDAFIVIGADERDGRVVNVPGVRSHLPDAQLQQFVNSKLNRKLDFSYQVGVCRGVELGVLRIPLQKRPFHLTKDYGRLSKGVVYVRRGSSTDVAQPDEIARMGDQTSLAGPPSDLKVRFIEWPDKLPVLDDVRVEQLSTGWEPPVRPSLPGMGVPEGSLELGGYLRNLTEYARLRARSVEVGLELRNPTTIPARNVRLVGKIHRTRAVAVYDLDDRPRAPTRSTHGFAIPDARPLARGLISNPEPEVSPTSDGWEVTVEFGDIRPKDEATTSSPFVVEVEESALVRLVGDLRGDNLPDRIPFDEILRVTSRSRPIEERDVMQWAR